MAYIIGREEEKYIFNQCIESKKPEFVAVFGRRRVGKTFLIREYFKHQFSFYFHPRNKNTQSCTHHNDNHLRREAKRILG